MPTLLRERLHDVLNDQAKKLQLITALNSLRNIPAYTTIAQIHGDRFFQCQHHNPTFLPWHRFYLSKFEAIFTGVQTGNKIGLPYWDWTKTTKEEALFFKNELATSSWNTRLNTTNILSRSSLFDNHFINNPILSNSTISNSTIITNVSTTTTQSWPGSKPTHINDINDYVNNDSSYMAFHNHIESIHDTIHASWIGGSMNTINDAAFDPLFWFTHANIDRLWCRWQSKHPTQKPCPDILGYKLQAGWGNQPKVSDLLKIPQSSTTFNLDYTYNDCADSKQKSLAITTISPNTIARLRNEPQTSLNITISNNQSITYQIDAYFNNKYAGSAFVFGHEPGTSMPRRRSPMMEDEIVRTIDVTEAFEKVTETKMPLQIQLRARPVDRDINIPLDSVAVIGLDLERYAAATPE